MTLTLTLFVVFEAIVIYAVSRRLMNLHAATLKYMKRKQVKIEQTKQQVKAADQRANCSEERNQKLSRFNHRLLEQQEELNRQKEELLQLHNQVQREMERSEQLLRNVLPAQIAEELKNSGTSRPEKFDQVTVFFSDIVNFTRKSSTIDPERVIEELNMIFTNFDRIFKKHHCERIKTSGDAYLAVSGMPNADPRHAQHILEAALEAMEFSRQLEQKAPYHWQMRMGVHSGRVVAGIVGTDKYIYDVFGDTINVASRMEHYSEPMRINVSEVTYRLTANEFRFTPRGQIETKGKGLIGMYFLEGAVETAPPKENPSSCH